ncbi:unnamed protein product [Periconia digitata]|uniref:PD-(D/E)XK nuclease-like domain-containing protein n=1 Tax=Periconia digitata TaxID=1303443 RepID=A0A9W4U3I1_9PLEO|nr:unnamed protein product [Periconia digitata]
MAIVRYSSKRTYDEALFDGLHVLPSLKQSPDIQRWVVALPDSKAGYAKKVQPIKRQRVLQSLSTTSKRLNYTEGDMATSPTRRSTRNRSPTKETLPAKEVVATTQGKGRREEAEASFQRNTTQAFSESAPSFRAPSSSLRSLSPPKKKTASTKADLAYLNPNIEFLPLETPIEISPVELVPFSKDPTLYRDLDKRIDYVVGLDLHRTTLKTLRRTPSINQTASFANETPIFLNIEVKRRHVARDPTVQLAAWIAAEYTKRRYEEWDLGFPVLAIEIDGDNWVMRVAAARVVPHTTDATQSPLAREMEAQPAEVDEGLISFPEDEYELFFFGPLDLGNTLTLQSSKRLLANLIDITGWGQSQFRAWWELNVQRVLEKRIGR